MTRLVGMGVASKPSLDEISHHGVKGMHWGVRRAGIHAARRRVDKARKVFKSEQEKFAAGKITKTQMDKAKRDFLQHPDRSTAVLTTAGEKAALAILISPAGSIAVASIARATSAGIESSQKQRARTK